MTETAKVTTMAKVTTAWVSRREASREVIREAVRQAKRRVTAIGHEIYYPATNSGWIDGSGPTTSSPSPYPHDVRGDVERAAAGGALAILAARGYEIPEGVYYEVRDLTQSGSAVERIRRALVGDSSGDSSGSRGERD